MLFLLVARRFPLQALRAQREEAARMQRIREDAQAAALVSNLQVEPCGNSGRARGGGGWHQFVTVG